jgi:branched-chain amino acid transport system substrate-binding protein
VKSIKVLLSIFCSLVILTACPGTPPKTDNQKAIVKIGAILPLTGDASVYGKAIKNGIDLAYNESPIKDRIQIIYEDDAGQAQTGVTAINKLAEQNVNVIVGGAMSSVAAAIAPISKDKKITLLSPTATLPSLTNAGEYFFRLWPSDNYDGEIMANHAYNSLGIKKVAVLYVNLDYGVGINQVFTDKFKGLGGSVVYDDGYAQGATDFRTQLQKVKESGAEALFLPGYYQEIANILKQAKELNLKIQILSVNSFYDPKLLEIAGPVAEGAIFTYPTFDNESKDAVTSKFVEKYNAAYNEKPDAFAAQGYDSFKVIESLIQAGNTDNEAIKNALSKVQNFEGVAGKFSFDENGDVIKDLRIMTVKNGKFETLKKIQ